MWHGTWQEANEDGCSRWEVLDTPRRLPLPESALSGPIGWGEVGPRHLLTCLARTQDGAEGRCLWVCPRPQGSYNPLKGQM